MTKRATIIIFNAIIALLCAAAIALYFVFPIFKINVSYSVSEESYQNMTEEYNIDVSEFIGDEDLTVQVSLSLDALDVVNSVTQPDAKQTLTRIVDKNMDGLLSELNELGKKMLDVMLRATSTVVHKEIKAQLTEYLKSNDSELSDEDALQMIQDAGITDEFLDEKVNDVITAITSSDATVESVSDTAVDVAKDVYKVLQESDKEEFADLEFTEENEKDVRDAVESALNEVADENGAINADDFVSVLMIKLLQGVNGTTNDNENEGEEPQENEGSGSDEATGGDVGKTFIANLSAQDASESETTTEDELKAEIHLFIADKIPDEAAPALRIIFIAIAALVLFSCLAWAYLLIKIIVKLFTPNPAIKLKLPIFLGWLPFLVFWAFPTIVTTVLLRSSTMPAEMAALSLSFFSSGIFAFAAAVLLIIIWIPYRKFRKKEKKKKN